MNTLTTLYKSKWVEIRGDFLRSNIATKDLDEFTGKFSSNDRAVSASDLGNAGRKLLHFLCRALLKHQTPNELLSVTDLLEQLKQLPETPLRQQFFMYSDFVKKCGNFAVHSHVLDQVDCGALIPAVLKLCQLFLLLLLREEALPYERTSATLWVGNLPTDITQSELARLADVSLDRCVIKQANWFAGSTRFNFGFINCVTRADAAAAKVQLEQLGRGLVIQYR